MLTGFSMS